MESIFYIAIIAVAATAVGFVAAMFIGRSRIADRDRSLGDMSLQLSRQSELLALSAQKERELMESMTLLREQLSQIRERNTSLTEQIEGQKVSQQESDDRIKTLFDSVASRILEEKQSSFAIMGSQQIKSVLEPFGKEISDFKNEMKRNFMDDVAKRASLSTELKHLMELNHKLSEEATNLTKALKGDKNNKIQGNWGEMILETILQNSGLAKGEHYFTQEQQVGDQGERLRPDVIVRYPDGREVIIDSKVSLLAYSRYVESESDEDRDYAIAEHIRSVKAHIDSLSSKRYDMRESSLDFVMMFMPIEPAYIVAMSSDHTLWDYAYKRRIIIVTPTHLITALKLVYDLWKRDIQTKNVLQIVERANRIYDKFDTFVGYMNSVGDSLNRSRDSYDKAMSGLTIGPGNLMRQVQLLQTLGIKGTKGKSNITAIDDDTEQ